MNTHYIARRAIISFAPGVEVDAYKVLATGEKRVGIEKAGLVIGYSRYWLPKLIERVEKNGDDTYKGKTWKALQNLGFTGTTVRVEFKLEQGGIGRPKTISKQDFLALIDYGMLIGKKKQADRESKKSGGLNYIVLIGEAQDWSVKTP